MCNKIRRISAEEYLRLSFTHFVRFHHEYDLFKAKNLTTNVTDYLQTTVIEAINNGSLQNGSINVITASDGSAMLVGESTNYCAPTDPCTNGAACRVNNSFIIGYTCGKIFTDQNYGQSCGKVLVVTWR